MPQFHHLKLACWIRCAILSLSCGIYLAAKMGGGAGIMGERLSRFTQDQDPGVFRGLFVTFHPKVKAMLRRQGADIETAEELAQETMLTVWRKAALFAGERGTVSAWIYTIARNLRIDRLRREAAWHRFYQQYEISERLQTTTKEEEGWQRNHSEIESALRELPPEQMRVVELAFIEGLSQSEISRKIEVPLGTVKSRMRLAFEKLRWAVEREL